MPVRPENPADWEVVGMAEHSDDGFSLVAGTAGLLWALEICLARLDQCFLSPSAWGTEAYNDTTSMVQRSCGWKFCAALICSKMLSAWVVSITYDVDGRFVVTKGFVLLSSPPSTRGPIPLYHHLCSTCWACPRLEHVRVSYTNLPPNQRSRYGYKNGA